MQHIIMDGASTRAPMVSLSRKRGRPRAERPQNDTGTPELIMKRLHRQTAEALDLCRERNIITEGQHWCGIHLRWLYTLRYGVPSVRAVDPAHFGGIEIKNDDQTWRAAREQEFSAAVALLRKHGAAQIVMDVCIYNQRPTFLEPPRELSPLYARENEKQRLIIRHGLNALADLWHRQPH